MRCPVETESAEILLDYCARSLDAETTAIVEAHIQQCESCRRFRDAQSMVWEALDTWEAAPISPDFDRRLYQRMAQEGRGSWWQRWLAPLRVLTARPAIPAMAAACLLVVGGLLLEYPKGVPLPARDSAQAREAEQIESTLDDLQMLKDMSALERQEGAKTL